MRAPEEDWRADCLSTSYPSSSGQHVEGIDSLRVCLDCSRDVRQLRVGTALDFGDHVFFKIGVGDRRNSDSRVSKFPRACR